MLRQDGQRIRHELDKLAESPEPRHVEFGTLQERPGYRPRVGGMRIISERGNDAPREPYGRTRKDGAPGIHRVTVHEDEKEVEANFESLPNRIKSSRCYAPPVRRNYIPKADSETRPLGVPTFEDKVAQRAVLMPMQPIYEADFMTCSYNFQCARVAHDVLRAGIMDNGHGHLSWRVPRSVRAVRRY